MKNKFIIFDRDGVINIEKHFLHKIEDFEYENTVIESLLKLGEMGYKFIIITNQSGIGKGYYSESDYKKLENFIMKDLESKGIIIEKTFFCPHHPEGIGQYQKDCDCRKPKTGNFLKAINEFNIDIENSYMIGDRVTDLIPANKLGFKTVLIKTGYGKENINKLQEHNLNSLIVENMIDFVNTLIV